MPSSTTKIRQLAQQVATIRWIVMLSLFTFVFGFETLEHIIVEGESISWRFSFEIFFFGVIGPILVFVILSWIQHNLLQLTQAYEEIHSLNTDLETRIEIKTAELVQVNDKLRQLDRLKSEFVSLVSHELRSPLTNVHGGVELVLQSLDPHSDAHHNILVVVQSEVERLIRLVKHILDVSALQAGQLQLNRGIVVLRPLIHEIVARSEPTGRNQHFILNLSPQLQPVWADEDRITDVLNNLINNAIKYSPEESNILVQATPEAGYIHILVKDEGIGIPLDEQERLFQPFYRGENATDVIQGYGLGLYFCYQLIQAHGGEIWVESLGKPDMGTTFHLRLPVDKGGEI
jgi:signal transduction histidine kinase